MHPRCIVLAGVLFGFSLANAANFTVTVTNHNGAGSLFQAITDANSTPGPDLITFNIATAGLTISPSNALPAITDPVTIDGSTQPGFTANPIVEINGTSAGTGTDGLRIFTSNCVIRGLVINRFNGDGIEIATNGNHRIEGNYIGLDLGGTIDRGNTLNGILLTNASDNFIGGTNRNLISGNGQNGIQIGGLASSNNVVAGNVIGLGRTETAINNAANGVFILAPGNLIGGTTAGSRNVISGNGSDGIEISGTNAFSNQIIDNLIGTDSTGTTNRGNSGDGILISGPGNNIGGVNPGEGNLISGNSDGIELTGTNAAFNQILGNLIGTDITGILPLANTGNGIQFTSNARSNSVGSATGPGANRIAFNAADGIFVNAGSNNLLRVNSIHSNIGLGIDLGANGVTANDAGDADTGANNLQNFPILTAATNETGSSSIAGTLNSRPSSTYEIDFYSSVFRDPTGNGEGETYLGSTTVTTDGASNATFLVSPSPLTGRYVTATATDTNGNTSEFSPALYATTTVTPAQFAVTNTNDNGAGSLRQAILDANNWVGAGRDTITFNIAGAGPHMISPRTTLPMIADAVLIDGYSQAGTVSNTLATGNNAVWIIRLDGATAGSGVNGLTLDSSNSAVRGIAITRFNGSGLVLTTNSVNSVVEGNLIGLGFDSTDLGNVANGVSINGSANRIGGDLPGSRNVISGNNTAGLSLAATAANNTIAGNFIGTDIGGVADVGNTGDGINVVSAGNVIGGTFANVIAGNNNDGIELNGATAAANIITGNFIGTDASGTLALGNGQNGILVGSNARSNVIGGVLPAEGNVIAHHTTGDGISLQSGTNNVIRGNSIFGNGDLGIDLGTSGVTANDNGDNDGGANQLQNYPVITNAVIHPSDVLVQGTLNSRPSTLYLLDFYGNVARDDSGFGQGAQYLGATSVTTDASSNGIFSATLPATVIGRFISATATDPFGNTSEFSFGVRAGSTRPPLSFSVLNTNNSGTGSLRQALLEAPRNSAATPHTIVFNISGTGSHSIFPLSPLPPIVESVIIDGFTQTGASANTLAGGNNGIWKIQIDGSTPAMSSTGLVVDVSGTTIRGLSIIRFTGQGIFLTTNSSNSVIEGNLVGLGSDNSAQPNNSHGLLIQGANNLIGGAAPSARNIISGNAQHGISFAGAIAQSNRVQGNFIGTDISGTTDLGNNNDGINVNTASFNQIGGAAPGEGNLLSGNNNDGIEIAIGTTSGNIIQGNLIGTSIIGTAPLGNGSQGININAARSNSIGGILTGQRNIIAFNGGDGIIISGTNNSVRGNHIFSNTELGIDLSNNGITGNDAGDGDTGGNQFQNFPVITSTTANVGNTVVAGTLNSRPSLAYELDFFASLTADPSGNGEGQQYLGSTTVNTDASGNGGFNITLPTQAIGRFITATATDPGGNSSEFSTNFSASSTLPPITLTVVNTNDSGAGSLRQALMDAGGHPAGPPNQIYFNIPGAGPHTIAPLTQLPTPTEPVLIDGYTQPGSTTNSLLNGFNATIKIRLDGISASGFSVDGFRLRAGNSVVRGIAFLRWPSSGVDLATGGSNRVAGCLFGIDVDGSNRGGATGVEIASSGNEIGGLSPGDRNVIAYNTSGHGVFIVGSGASNNIVRGNFIGTDFSGTIARGNINGIEIQDAGNNMIGGTQPGARNLISGNTSRGIRITTFTAGASSGNIIQGNFIGTDVTGSVDLGNNFEGIVLDVAGAFGTIIGGPAVGAGNIISGNNQEGVDLGFGSGSIVQGNRIGLGLTGNAVSNSAAGIILAGSSNLIGGTFPGEGNIIAYNRQNGIYVAAGTNNQIRGNIIYANDWPGTFQPGLGIDLVGEGITVNDSGDADAGANNRQNFPVITTASGGASSMTIQGSLNSAANLTYQLDFFANIACDGGGNGEGQFYLGNGSVNTDASGNGTFNVTVPVAASGRFITATATDPLGNSSEFCACFEATLSNPPITLTVINTNDSGSGSLRQAILDSNSHISSSNNTIAFNIPGSGIQRIRPLSSLPAFSQPVTIDGFTQPGASANTLSNAINANWLIELNGSLAASNQKGLRLNIPRLVIRGLRIAGFNEIGLELLSSNAVVAGNFIFSNYFGGIEIVNAHNNRIGGTAPADRNIISGHGGSRAIEIGGGNRNQILGNWIGPGPDGTNSLGNQFDGVNLFGNSSDNQIGDGTAAGANLIAFNGGGVYIQNGTNNSVRANRIFSNSLGIDLGFGGVTANDPGDVDGGANHLQNFPIMTNAVANAGSTVIQGTLNSLPNTSYILDFYANNACDFSGNGEGEFYLGSGNVVTDGSGNADFNVTLPVTIPALNLSATATDPTGNTSEFSPCHRPGTITIPPATFLVTNTNDSGPGSLRQAVLDASARLTGLNHSIHFNIAAAGLQVISLASPLPSPAQPIIIDGFTQPGTQPNTAATNDNATRLIRIFGTNAGAFVSMINLTNPGNVIRGLEISGFGSSAILLSSDRNILEGNFIYNNGGDGISVIGSDANVIGGNTFAQRNIIAANGGTGIDLSGNASSNRVVGNLIGLSPSGGSLSNRLGGIVILDGVQNIIGEPGQGNAIAFNQTYGIGLGLGTNNSIRGNTFHSNNGLAIDLGNFGVTANDVGDADTGGNNRQNFPVLTAAAATNVGGMLIEGTLNSLPNRLYQLDFYFNTTCDPTGNGEGEIFIGSGAVTTDGSGNGSFSSPIAYNAVPGFVTAVATDPNGNTSEFCACRATTSTIPPQTLIVSTTADSGAGSLRQAILTANQLFTAGSNSIAFNIPGSGERLIAPALPLPAITQPILVDGYTQPGTSLNTSSTSHTAVVLVRIDGANAGAGANGLSINTSNTLIRGLILTRFDGAGVVVAGASNIIEGNLIGVIQGSALTLASTASPASTGNGTGVLMQGRGNMIGGTALSSRNVISANDGDGILMFGPGATGNRTQGNWIGNATDATGRSGNMRNGVAFDGNASGNSVGPGNLIAYNAHAGIAVLNGNSNVFTENSYDGNAGIPIDLGGDGPTRNDIGDVDAGPNGLKNYPVITHLQNMGNNIMYVKGYFPQFNTPPQERQRTTAFPSSEFFEDLAMFGSAAPDELFLYMFLGLAVAPENDGTFERTVPGNIPAGTEVRVTATGNGSTSEMSPQVTVTPPPTAMADLVVTHTVTPTSGLTGTVYTITMTVSNAGPAAAEQVFAAILPPLLNMEYISSSSSVGTPGVFRGVEIGVASLPPNGTFTVTVQLRAVESRQEVFISNATSTTPDPNLENNTANGNFTTYIRVDNRVAIVMQPSDTNATVQQGQSVSIGYKLKNNGPDSAINLSGDLYYPYGSLLNGMSGQGATFTTGTPNERFVAGLYKDIYCREPDNFGLSTWASRLNGGMTTRRQVVDSFLGSPEGRLTQITDFSKSYLRVARTQVELARAFAEILDGKTDQEFQEDFLGSDEFFQKKGGAINPFVNGVYRHLLERTPTTQEAENWRGQLWGGLGREMWVGQLLDTPEVSSVTVGDFYNKVVRRDPTAAETSAGTTRLQAGATYQSVLGDIYSSDEYYQNVGPVLGVKYNGTISIGQEVEFTTQQRFNYLGEQKIHYTFVPEELDSNFSDNEGDISLNVVGFALVDWGDVPDSYHTLANNAGASHPIVLGFRLGGSLDPDFDGQPGFQAMGDDFDESDDDDGVVFRGPLSPGVRTAIEVTASQLGRLDFWIDFNRNGTFDHRPVIGQNDYANDLIIGHTGGSYLLLPGVNVIEIFSPSNSFITGITYARFRFSSAGGLLPVGAAADGEVEDYQVSIYPVFPDFGDAPDSEGNPFPGYYTLLSHNGAYHLRTIADFYLGTRIDHEGNGQPDPSALGDDNGNGVDQPETTEDDEDGVTFLTEFLPGQAATIQVVATIQGVPSGKLDAWIDWNSDGFWTVAEKVLNSVNLIHGTNIFKVAVPATAEAGITFSRFRMSQNGNLEVFGPANTGEVEDYAVFIGRRNFTQTVREGNNLRLEWSAGAVLQRAPTILGPWADVPGATTPFIVQPSDGTSFYRLRF